LFGLHQFPARKIRLRQAVDSIKHRDDAVPPHQDMKRKVKLAIIVQASWPLQRPG
jgi:hypothetical protein